MSEPEIESIESTDELPPPFMKSWKRLYGTVLINLVILIVIFYLMTISLS